MKEYNLIVLLPFIKGAFLFIICVALGRVVSGYVIPPLFKPLDLRTKTLVAKVINYIAIILGLLIAMKQVGLDISVLLGAAGIMTIAVGFAAQTSTANIISGVFLMFEKRFGVSDVIEVGQNIGEVLSIGLLSTEMRTHDNLSVRIPNEMLMKTEVKNYTRFEIRRIDLKLRVKIDEDFEKVKSLLLETTAENPYFLDEPSPIFVVERQSDAGLEFQFSVWTKREHFLEQKNKLQIEILKTFNKNGVEVPFPKRIMTTDQKNHMDSQENATNEAVK